ncbi:MAG: hypothetical protein BGO01_21280 [Armatimonadetes bacterium 55-13]|nr:BamA/TamA family outer membrane protein [Armatimonadota bacterium]OJU64640.1 MAG: hypothetical protein BGO01_21280 [Armatimonadetes bacterium 55-13]
MKSRFVFTCVGAIWAAVAFAQNVAAIEIKGNVHVNTEAIRAAMRTHVGQPFLIDALIADKEAIEGMGFFQSVETEVVLDDKQDRHIIVRVVEWPLIKEIRVVGNRAVGKEAILKALEIDTDKPFNSRLVKPAVERVRDLYKKSGFFGDVSEFQILPNEPGVLLVQVMEMEVGSVHYEGNQRTKGTTLDRLIRTRSGDPYRRDRVISDNRRLENTGWFEDLSITEGFQETGKVNLNFKFKEAKTRNLIWGLQADAGSPWAGTLRVSETNWRGTGQGVGLDFSQGTRGPGPSLGFDYTNPFFDKNNTSLKVAVFTLLTYRFAGTSFGNNVAPTPDDVYTERRVGGSLSLGREVGKDLVGTVSITAEQVKTNDVSDLGATGFVQQDGDLTKLSVGITRNRRDYDPDPSRGDWLHLEVQPSVSHISKIGGDLTNESSTGTHGFVKTSAEYRTYYSPQGPRLLSELSAPRSVFAFRARLGMIYGDTPFFEQFFAGGANSVRGYQEERFWGKQSLLTTLEYRHPFNRDFSLIGFVDYGGAWGGYSGINRFSQSDSIRMNLGYGLGFKYNVPKLGPIRVDLGFDSKGRSRTHFQIATSF